jgi:hypothetical protein
MAKSPMQTVMDLFNKSSDSNGIVSIAHKKKQAVSSGPSYRASLESKKRNDMHKRCKSELMRPYQDTYRTQIPALLLAVADETALRRVALRKLKTAENELSLGLSLMNALNSQKGALLDKWEDFKMNLTSDEVRVCEDWLDEFYRDVEPKSNSN